MIEMVLLCLLAIPLARIVRAPLSFAWRFVVDAIERRFGEKID
ncbi:hypothetical protein [Ferrimonas pelagia]|uniref:Uncharacterized protein n=1 Tax=Ferrimonas pelagia TaxID=1177826 RepID=A0ABP9EVS9_9GAMM